MSLRQFENIYCLACQMNSKTFMINVQLIVSRDIYYFDKSVSIRLVFYGFPRVLVIEHSLIIK